MRSEPAILALYRACALLPGAASVLYVFNLFFATTSHLGAADITLFTSYSSGSGGACAPLPLLTPTPKPCLPIPRLPLPGGSPFIALLCLRLCLPIAPVASLARFTLISRQGQTFPPAPSHLTYRCNRARLLVGNL